MPGGSTARMELVEATICAMARSMLTSGWKYTFSTATPCRVVLSMFLMPLTLLDNANSEYVVTRCSISGVSSPV